jgi:HTH-type transcriptional regulator / antitoxin HigA
MARVLPSRYQNDSPSLPGQTIQEVLDANNMSQASLASRMGRPVQAINEIVRGKKSITAATALELEKVLGLPAKFWLNLEQNYQEATARINQQAQCQAELKRVSDFPYAEMARLNLVAGTRKIKERYENLLAFLKVASFEALKKQMQKEVLAFRASKSASTISTEKLAVWLAMGELAANKIEIKKFDKAMLRKSLPVFKKLTLESSFQSRLVQAGAECGVAILLVPGFKGFPVSGVTRWVGNTPHLQISLRYKNEGSFWFSVFHEIGHVLLHGRRKVFIEGVGNSSVEEKEANQFARSQLLTDSSFDELAAHAKISRKIILDAAGQAGISPGIVVGILQHAEIIPYNKHQNMIRKMTWGEGEPQ